MLPIPKHQRSEPRGAYSALQRNAEAYAETVYGKEKAAGATNTKRLPNLPPKQVGKAAYSALYHNTHRL